MTVKGYEERFPPTRLSAGCGFRKETIAGMRRNVRDAPIPAVRSVRSNLVTPSSLKPTLATLFQPDTEADCPREQGPEPAVEIDVEPRTDHGMIWPERRSREVHN